MEGSKQLEETILILMCFNRDKDEDNALAIPMATSHTKHFSVKCGDFYI